MTQNDEGPHVHEWYPLTYFEPVPGEEEAKPEVALWACSGRTRRGDACLATATALDFEKDYLREVKRRESERNEREQRHWNWEE